MLSVNRINKSYNLVTILKDITFSLKPGQRLGIVGVNGCGKTTLLKIIMGLIKPDSGSVQFTPADLRVSYLPQGLAPADTDTIDSFLNSHVQSTDNLEDALSRVSNALMLDPENTDLHEQYDRILAQLSMKIHSSGSQFEILSSLGLGQYELDMPVKFLSGGQKTRLALSSVLLSNPQLLLLDEPTNHLDIEMLEWFEEWLTRFQGAILMVSHDRAFLDKTANGILRIDTRTHEMKQYAGNYSAYLEQRMAEQEKAWQSYQDQQDEISRLQTTAHRIRSIGNFRKGGKSDTTSGTDGFTAGFFKDRSLETMRRAKAIEKKLDLLKGDKHIDKPKSDWEMKMDFRNQAESSRDVLILEDLAIGYDQQPLIEHVNLILRYGQRCAFIGPNGIGKTTLLKTITGKIQPLAGNSRLGPNIKMGYMAQEQEDIDPVSNPYETIYKRSGMSETETRYFLSKFLFKGDEVFTSNHSLSYGERARLMLACLVADGCNFLVLDEPINHLDIPSRTQFEQALANFEGTVLAVVHDRYFIDSFATELWKFGEGKIQQIFLD